MLFLGIFSVATPLDIFFVDAFDCISR